MNRTIVPWNLMPDAFLKAHRVFGFLFLLIWCSAAALAQTAGQPTNSAAPFSIHVTHILGFENVAHNANGTLSIQGDTLQFQNGDKPAVQVKTASVQDVFLGEQSKQVGGLPMTLGKAAAPYGGGRVISLFAHKKYDTLVLEYVDTDGGVHGALFQLNRGQAESVRNELMARGAHISHVDDQPMVESNVEVSSENK